jgi:oligopeptide transport system substrate-binding protein
MKFKRVLYQLVLSTAILGLLFGCSRQQKEKREQASEVKLYIQAELLSLDPRIGGDRRSQFVLRDLFEGLVRMGRDDKPELAMAESYTLSDDGTVYTFKLRPAKWSNGLPVTADDFAWAWKKMVDPSFATSYCYSFFLLKNGQKAYKKECPLDEVGVKALDDQTLQVTLEHPAPYFLGFLSNPLFSPVCRAVAEKNPDWAAGAAPVFVSNGPFILKERRLKSHIIFEKNPLYWNTKDPARSDKISFAIIEDPQTAYNMYQAGELDWYGDPCGNMTLEMLSELKKTGKLITKPISNVFWMLCNVNAPQLSVQKIRQAIACAINRKEICDTLLQGGETPAYSLVPESMTLLEEKTFEDNRPDLARKLFEEGMRELGYTKETFPPLIITHWADPSIKSVMETIQQQVTKVLGIRVELSAQDWSSFLRKLSSCDFQLIGVSWFTWWEDPTYNLEHLKFKNNGINGSGWENARYINLLDLADNALDPLERRNYLRQAETLVMTELPLIPLFYKTAQYVKAPGVVGEYFNPIGQMDLKWIEKRQTT